jgi:NAD-dependent deacetylase
MSWSSTATLDASSAWSAARRWTPTDNCSRLFPPDAPVEGCTSRSSFSSAEARNAAHDTDVMLVIGSTGEVYPAALVPRWAAEAGATIVEINPEPSEFTGTVSDLHLAMKAAEAFGLIE